ncbi:MAG: anion permease [Calditrichaeota bacterium]|nr:MAG: anion permease [Calditrichota bacterium]MBL1204799.1 anion permease [Calditrichota bacterium]NOG44628.1 inorganic phosphate transporter [Calditrichota bacterium]
MEVTTILLIIALGAGFYMAWSIGANDVANAMGTSVGSGALTVKRAVIIAAVLEFAGAFLVGTHVSETIRKGIISPELFLGNEFDLVFGMIGALLAAAVWLQIASYFGWPVSTTHSIVGAVLGFGVMYGGMHAADWAKVGSIAASWVISPLLSGTISYLIFMLIRRLIFYSDDPVRIAKKMTPYLVFFVFLVLTLAMVFKGLKNLKLDLGFSEAFLVAIIVGVVAAIISSFLVKRIKHVEQKEKLNVKQPAAVGKRIDKALVHLQKALAKSDGQLGSELSNVVGDLSTLHNDLSRKLDTSTESSDYKTVEKIFVYLQILSAGFVAFAHGANDVANAVGPLAAVITVISTGSFAAKSAVPIWVLGLGGLGIVIGLSTWGWRVMMTIGKKITELTPSRGFAAEFAAAITIVLASKLGIPVSTTHTLVGGVLGVGFARGIKALNLKVVTNIFISWIITIPVGAIGAIIFYYILQAIFG